MTVDLDKQKLMWTIFNLVKQLSNGQQVATVDKWIFPSELGVEKMDIRFTELGESMLISVFINGEVEDADNQV